MAERIRTGLARAGRNAAAFRILLATTALASLGFPAIATAQQAGLELAQAGSATIAFSIPAGPLPGALAAFGDRTGLQVLYPADLARGVASPGVSGNQTPEAALQRLLAGTGLTYRFTDTRTVTLVEAPQGGGLTTLPMISVEGQRSGTENAWGPVDGYVATRSAAATKTDTPLLETPQSVSVVTRDEMAMRKPRTIGDALGYTAGVQAGLLGDSTGYGGDATAIRGFGGNGTSGPSFNEYVDGLKLGGSGYVVSGIEPYMFERVEVMKGPASVLYGQSTPGGLINMVSKRPVDRPIGEVELQTGSYGRLQGAFDVSDRLDAEGKFLYRLSGLAFDTESQVDFTDRERVAIAPAFTWNPNGSTSLTILTRYQKDDFGGSPLNWLPSLGTVRDNPNGSLSPDFFSGDPNYMRWDREHYSAGYILEHQLEEIWTFRQNARYTHNTLDFANVYIASLQANNRIANRQAFGMVEHADDWTIDNHAQADFSTGLLQHKVLVGIDAQWLNNDTNRVLGTAPTIDIFNPVYHQTITVAPYQDRETEGRQYGVYVQEQIELGNWHLLLGLRKDWASATSRDLMAVTSTKQKDDALTKRAGLLYAFENGISPYVSYTESFDPQVGSQLLSGGVAKPSEGQQYEVGIKYQPPGSNSLITASLFEITRSNVTTASGVPGFFLQTGEIESRGFELEGKASLAEGLNISAAYTLLDAEVTQSNNTATGVDGVTVPVKGKIPTRIPTHAASLWADYTLQQGDLRGLGVGLGTRYVGTAQGDDANSFEVPAYLLFDAAMFYDLGHLRPGLNGFQLGLNVSNLFDEDYVATCFAVNRCYFGTGRTAIASLRYRW